MTLSNADKLRFAEVEDRITREFGDSDTMDFLEYLKTQVVENRLRQVRQDSLEESIEFLVNECGELQKEVNEYRQQEEAKLTEDKELDLTQIDGFPNHSISTDGRIFVKSYSDLRGSVRKPKELKQSLNADGYPTVLLTNGGKKRTVTVHRLLGETLLERVDGKDTINHKDGDKTNNTLENLEWADRSEQMIHAYSNGLKRYSDNARKMVRKAVGKPVKCFNKETSETTYHFTARDCSKYVGKSERWCDKIIGSQNGETYKYSLEYVTEAELSEKASLSILVELVERWSIERGMHLSEPSKQMLKVSEEVGEIARSIVRNDTDSLKDAIGDVVITLIILAQQIGTTLEDCVMLAYDEIKDRKGKLVDGVFIKESDL